MLLNIGCGTTYHSEWVNLDMNPARPDVRKIDLRQGLPFPESVADVCYSSHVLEHLEQEDGVRFLRDVFRVLKPGGVVRIVVPDLEGIARSYLSVLDDLVAGRDRAKSDYEWMMLELLDQSVRGVSGGRMAKFFAGDRAVNRAFVLSRAGSEAQWLMDESNRGLSERAFSRIRERGLGWLLRRLRLQLAGLAAFAVGGKEARLALREGLVRRSGEVHRWMYDRFSLGELMKASGFAEVRVCSAHESRIPDFARYELDVVEDAVRKPDSLFMEGVRA